MRPLNERSTWFILRMGDPEDCLMNWKVNTVLSDAARGDEKTDGPEEKNRSDHKKKCISFI